MSLAKYLRARYDEEESAFYQWDSDGRARVGIMWTGRAPGYTTVAQSLGDDSWIADGREIFDAQHALVLLDSHQALADIQAKRRVVAEVMGWRHLVVDDCWYTCPAATDEHDGDHCCRDDVTECECGLEWRKKQILQALALPYVDRDDFQDEWKD